MSTATSGLTQVTSQYHWPKPSTVLSFAVLVQLLAPACYDHNVEQFTHPRPEQREYPYVNVNGLATNAAWPVDM